jgi:hypothetical protein
MLRQLCREDIFSTNGAETTDYLHSNKKNFNPYLTAYSTLAQKLAQDLNDPYIQQCK